MKKKIAFKFLGIKPPPLVIKTFSQHIHVIFRDPWYQPMAPGLSDSTAAVVPLVKTSDIARADAEAIVQEARFNPVSWKVRSTVQP